jgi:hypothetical protein
VVAGYYTPSGFPQDERAFVRDTDGTITTFVVPGSMLTVARSINGAGAITGYYVGGSGGPSHGFVRDPFGNFLSFDANQDFGSTSPQSITAGGAVTGYYLSSRPGFLSRGFLREDNGTITLFDPPGSISTTALSINPTEAITGYYQRADGSVHGFLRQPSGHIVSFDPPGSTGTFPVGINYSGAITGCYVTADGGFGFVRDAAETITSFDPGPGTTSASINNHGVIAGDYSGTGRSGFLRSPDGTITLLAVPNFCLSIVIARPKSINDAGAVTGSCQVPGGEVGWVRFP